MAYDESIADRVRKLMAEEGEVDERRMFGGLAFFIAGNMAVCASSRGGLMVRVDPMESERLVEETAAEPMEMQGRAMWGWLHVDGESALRDGEIAKWVAIGTDYVRMLPPKDAGQV